jgi:hypothetical protein
VIRALAKSTGSEGRRLYGFSLSHCHLHWALDTTSIQMMGQTSWRQSVQSITRFFILSLGIL